MVETDEDPINDDTDEEPVRDVEEEATDKPEAIPTEGRPIQEQPAMEELAREHFLEGNCTEVPTLECPALGQESLPEGLQEDVQVVVHTPEDEMDQWC